MEKKLLKCKFCGHEWKSGSEMIWITCSCCQNKSKYPKDNEKKDENKNKEQK